MTGWDARDAHALAGPQEVQVVTRRQGGTLRRAECVPPRANRASSNGPAVGAAEPA
jgi:hypothetical protein